MSQPRIIFMGTPEFAVAILEQMRQLGAVITAVVCQPDKATGRHHVLTAPPAKQWAVSNGVTVLQPAKLRTDCQAVIDLRPELIISCAYGQFVPDAILAAPRLGCINIHPSLLPKLRGGAPIQRAIIDGLDETGVTLMVMAAAMDAGDIIDQCHVGIDIDDTYGTLEDKLMKASCQLLRDNWARLVTGGYPTLPQDGAQATFGYNVKETDEHIDFSRGYRGVYDQIRGLIPSPVGYVMLEGRKIKLWQVAMTDQMLEAPDGTVHFMDGAMGIVVQGRLLKVDAVQPEGKGRMAARDFHNGAGRTAEGKVLG